MTRDYPRLIKGKGGISIKLHRLNEEDQDRMLEFARGLDNESLLFLRVDLTRPESIERIIREQEGDRRVTLLAIEDGQVVGYGSLGRSELDWTRHIGEIRVIVNPEYRGQGLGSLLSRELFEVAQDLGLTKIVARVVREQQGAREMFERLGFSAEALLADWVIDRTGKTRDLVLMSYDVTALTN
jgi:RimJ/RimL family protein N-acetyltransferase